MSTRQSINPSGLHPAPGFSHVTVAESSRTAYVAGQLALAPDFSIVGGSDLGEQTAAAMRNVKLVLDSLGAGFEHVVRRTIYTTQPTEYEVITAAIEEVQGSREHPAQTIIGVTGLAVAGLLIEIEVTVALPEASRE